MKKIHNLFMLLFSIILITACKDSTVTENTQTYDETGYLHGFPTGVISESASPFDLAIDGQGYFVIRESGTNHLFYTRNGSFEIDEEGYLVTKNGDNVQGWETDNEGNIMGSTVDIQFFINIYPLSDSVEISRLSIDSNGLITYNDEEDNVIPIYEISLAKFTDCHSLLQAAEGYFDETNTSGSATISIPESNGLGSIESYALEEINTEQSFETNISIQGIGYMILKNPASPNQYYYTRSGDFRLNSEGNVVNSENYILQGWELEQDEDTGEYEITGALSDMAVTSFTLQPFPTDTTKLIVNLDAGAQNNSPGNGALSQAWNGDVSLEQHISPTSYEYETTTRVYDALGSYHDITFFFDKGDNDRTFEYIITCNPVDDLRFGFNSDSHEKGNGMLGRGIVSFTPEGEIDDITFEQLVSVDPDENGAWEVKDKSTDLFNNHHQFEADFLGGASTQQLIEFDLGAWYNGSSWVKDTIATTSFPQASVTIEHSANGYAAGDLKSMTLDSSGNITNHYSGYTGDMNIPFFRIALASFKFPNELKEISNGIFMATAGSGDSFTAPPETNDLGSLLFIVK